MKSKAKLVKKIIVTLVVICISFYFIFGFFSVKEELEPKAVPTLDRLEEILETKDLEKVSIHRLSRKLVLIFKEGSSWEGNNPVEVAYTQGYEGELTEQLLDKVKELNNKRSPKNRVILEIDTAGEGKSVFDFIFPFIFIGGIIFLLFFVARRRAKMMMGGMNQVNNLKNRTLNADKAKKKDVPDIKFTDVAGIDEAVAEVQELKEFLENPDKFTAIGASIPKGALLYGPPGTGKTLLARAIAGEAGVPFFQVAGSDFIEMFVGVGASRVRDLFSRAKANAPSIIFIDEIDAIGRHRGGGLGTGHDEREQTLNQLLVEMDGFEQSNVIIIAATNRPDILDPALLRAGRFSRQIEVHAPDLQGRIKILKIHAKNKKLESERLLEVVAKQTPGFTGADLANVLNEAAIFAVRAKKQVIESKEFEDAIERVLTGPRSSKILSEQERRIVAYHESGHALVGHALKHMDPIHKITIIPHGRTLGYTQPLPEDDRYLLHKQQLLDRLAMSLGGRAAEELIFIDSTTGAQNDIEHATQIARQMITQFGMSDEMGPMQYGRLAGSVFLGRDLTQHQDYSEATAHQIDQAIRSFLTRALEEARYIIETNRDILEKIVGVLLEKETLIREEIQEIFKDVPSYVRIAEGLKTE